MRNTRERSALCTQPISLSLAVPPPWQCCASCSCWSPPCTSFLGILPDNHPPDLCPSHQREPWDSFHEPPGTSFHLQPCRFTWKQWHCRVSTSGGDPGKQSSSHQGAGMEQAEEPGLLLSSLKGSFLKLLLFPKLPDFGRAPFSILHCIRVQI